MAVNGSDTDGDGYYETFSFELEFGAASEEGSIYDVSALIHCQATGQSWYTEAWSVTGSNSGKVFVVFDQLDFVLSGTHDLALAAELWDAAFVTKHAETAAVQGGPVKAEAPGPDPPPGSAPAPPTLSSPTKTSMVLTLNSNGAPDDASYCVRCVASEPHDPNWVSKYVWPLEGRGLRFDVPVWRYLSLWQNLPITDLQPGTGYSFTARVRYDDIESADSEPAALYTLPTVPCQLTVTRVSGTSISLALDAGAYPGGTLFAIKCVATDPADSSYLQLWIGECGRPSPGPVWLTAEQSAGIYAAGLQSLTTYSFAAHAKSADGQTAALCAAAAARTSAPGDVNGDGRVNILDLITTRSYLNKDACLNAAAAAADANGDGRINIIDLILCRLGLGRTYAGE